jgi:hypothetical protein
MVLLLQFALMTLLEEYPSRVGPLGNEIVRRTESSRMSEANSSQHLRKERTESGTAACIGGDQQRFRHRETKYLGVLIDTRPKPRTT